MSGVKHTPGPWTDKGGSAGAVWAGNEFIASIYPNAQPGWDGYGRFDRQDETEANARLIAAAPDLFEAGVGLLKAYRSAVKMCGDDALDLVADHPESWASKMEAALSKATTQQEGR